MRLSFREISLYRYRQVIGVAVFGLVLVLLLTVRLESIPRGLSAAEQASTVQSVTLNVLSSPPDAVVNAPYLLLQKASVAVFGVTTLAIKLPSILLGLCLAAGMVVLLRRFFRLSATSVTALLMITSIPFLTMGRTGTPLIMLSVLTVLLMIVGAAILASRPRFSLPWKALAVLLAISLTYTPLGIYPLLAFLLAAALHPHLRYHLTHTKPSQWVILAAAGLVALIPLVLAVWRQPDLLLSLAGIPTDLPTGQDVLANLGQIAASFFLFTEPHYGLIHTPLFGLPLVILMLLGILQLIKDRHSARAYVLLGWVGVLLIILALDPKHVINLFVPLILLLAVGIEALLREWYSLFPRNPYARIAALVPLTVLVFGIASTEISRYFDGHRYSAGIQAEIFDATLPVLRADLDQPPLADRSTVYLVAARDHRAFYDLLRRDYPNLQVVAEPQPLQPGQANLVLEDAEVDIMEGVHGQLTDFAVSSDSDQPLLFETYSRD